MPNEGFGFLDAYAAVCGADDRRALPLGPAAGG
jgi:hypothetical protein